MAGNRFYRYSLGKFINKEINKSSNIIIIWGKLEFRVVILLFKYLFFNKNL